MPSNAEQMDLVVPQSPGLDVSKRDDFDKKDASNAIESDLSLCYNKICSVVNKGSKLTIG